MQMTLTSGHVRRLALAAGLAASLAFGAAPATAAEIDLVIENVKSGEGALLIAVYASADDFRKKAVRELKMAVAQPTSKIRIDGLAAGDYAIALFHDRNSNGKVDSNLFGIPTEPYGFSNNPANLMSPASWEQARFTLGDAAQIVTVKLSD